MVSPFPAQFFKDTCPHYPEPLLQDLNIHLMSKCESGDLVSANLKVWIRVGPFFFRWVLRETKRTPLRHVGGVCKQVQYLGTKRYLGVYMGLHNTYTSPPSPHKNKKQATKKKNKQQRKTNSASSKLHTPYFTPPKKEERHEQFTSSFWVTRPNSPQMVVYVGNIPPTTASFRLGTYDNSNTKRRTLLHPHPQPPHPQK